MALIFFNVARTETDERYVAINVEDFLLWWGWVNL